MNYVRKLGFEETPDYDFLRELFTKVLKTLGEPEDGVFDWMLLNGGKGWEAGHVCRQLHAYISSESAETLCRLRPSWPLRTVALLTRHTESTGGIANAPTGRHATRFSRMAHRHRRRWFLRRRLPTSRGATVAPTMLLGVVRASTLVCNH